MLKNQPRYFFWLILNFNMDNLNTNVTNIFTNNTISFVILVRKFAIFVFKKLKFRALKFMLLF